MLSGTHSMTKMPLMAAEQSLTLFHKTALLSHNQIEHLFIIAHNPRNRYMRSGKTEKIKKCTRRKQKSLHITI